MTPVSHAIASGAVSAVFAYATRSWSGTAACFLSGIFIDVDHIFDFMLHKKKIPLSYQELDNFCGKEKAGGLSLIFHSYELLLAFWIAVFYFNLGPLWLGTAIGVTIHMLCDQIVNSFRPLAYFLVYRIKHGFDKKYIFLPEEYEKFI